MTFDENEAFVMKNWHERIENLDTTLFDAISSQTSLGDRRSLLAIQRATAKAYQKYTYLGIGSHLGGSIQPHLVDPRCKKIYSIDPRPYQQPDDRAPGYVATYEDNSTERMLHLLRESYGSTEKIMCFELNTCDIDVSNIEESPELIFIDGEHTKSAVLADFDFCSKVADSRATIIFHDF